MLTVYIVNVNTCTFNTLNVTNETNVTSVMLNVNVNRLPLKIITPRLNQTLWMAGETIF